MKIRVEITDGAEKTVKEYEGEDISWRHHVIRDVVDFLSMVLRITAAPQPEQQEKYTAVDGMGELTLRERLEWFLKVECQRNWYNSIQVKNMYEQTFHEKMNLSTVSTYLARMYRDGAVERRGNRRQREYRVLAEKPSTEDVKEGVNL